MVLPYKAKRVMIKVGSDIVGVVEGYTNEGIREGGVEPHYTSETGKHAIGTKHLTFSLRRWMYIDPNKKRLLYDLWKNSTIFMLYFGISDSATNPTDILAGTEFVLSDCVAYRWRPVTGSANDIVAEEITGEALDYIDSDVTD